MIDDENIFEHMKASVTVWGVGVFMSLFERNYKVIKMYKSIYW